MPLSTLIVEGKLDAEILFAVLQGDPVVERGGSKNALKPQAREKCRGGVATGYLRDRDFDHEPPQDRSCAVVDSEHEGKPLGWRWVRHEIENYLIDPLIVEAALGIDQKDWSVILTEVAGRIRWYQIARWTIGEVRRNLPPHHELRTRTEDLGEKIQLPQDIGEIPCLDWCRNDIAQYRDRIVEQMASATVESLIASRSIRVSAANLGEADNVLIWCSGKDLLAGLPSEVLLSAGTQTPGALRAKLRDWIRSHPEHALECFDEWQDLIRQIRS